jgi:hypothetical protein
MSLQAGIASGALASAAVGATNVAGTLIAGAHYFSSLLLCICRLALLRVPWPALP